MDRSEYLDDFLADTHEHVDVFTNALISYEEDGNMKHLDEMFRVMHSVKSTAAMMEFNAISEIAHISEDILDRLRKQNDKPEEKVISLMLEIRDFFEESLKAIEKGSTLPSKEKARIKRKLNTVKKSISQDESNSNDATVHVPSPNDVMGEIQRFEIEGLKEALLDGNTVHYLIINIDPECPMKGVRAAMAFTKIESLESLVTKAFPDVEDIQKGDIGPSFGVVVIVPGDILELVKALERISEVEGVEYHDLSESLTAISTENIQYSSDAEIKDDGEGKEGDPKSSSENQAGSDDTGKSSDMTGDTSGSSKQMIRVSVKKLDDLLNLVGETVISKIRLMKISSDNDIPDLQETMSELERTIDSIQDIAMDLRMVPLKHIMNQLPRMVRDLSLSTGKKAKLHLEGMDVEIDRRILDQIRDPLVHAIRNAVDHGIEDPATRKKSKKDETGHIWVSAAREKGYVRMVIRDDGAGIDSEAIKEKAKELGIEETSVEDIVFRSGFSTKKEVSDVSGRGVGMDVVKSVIETMGGSVTLESSKGEGTSIIMDLPVSLAIAKALLVDVSKHIYAIPLDVIADIVAMTKKDIKKIKGSENLDIRGEIVPIVWLSKIFDLPASASDFWYVVVSEKGTRKIGIVIDEVLGQQDIVIKSISDLLTDIRGFSGATVMGDGNVVLIIDVNRLFLGD